MGSGLGTHVHPWLIHGNVWQNQYSIVKQNKVKIKIILKIKKKKKKTFNSFTAGTPGSSKDRPSFSQITALDSIHKLTAQSPAQASPLPMGS